MSKKHFTSTRNGLVRGPGGFTIDADHPILAKAIAAMLNDDWKEAKRLTKSIGLFQGEIIEVIGRNDPRHFANQLKAQIKSLRRSLRVRSK